MRSGDVEDPLRGSRTSGVWIGLALLVLILFLLAVFVLQNTQEVSVTFLGWDGVAPLAAAHHKLTSAGWLERARLVRAKCVAPIPAESAAGGHRRNMLQRH